MCRLEVSWLVAGLDLYLSLSLSEVSVSARSSTSSFCLLCIQRPSLPMTDSANMQAQLGTCTLRRYTDYEPKPGQGELQQLGQWWACPRQKRRLSQDRETSTTNCASNTTDLNAGQVSSLLGLCKHTNDAGGVGGEGACTIQEQALSNVR